MPYLSEGIGLFDYRNVAFPALLRDDVGRHWVVYQSGRQLERLVIQEEA
jgi:hypothetical protein